MSLDSYRVLVLAPTENDSAVAAGVLLDAGIEAVVCKDIQTLSVQMREECAAIVVAEEALPSDELPALHLVLQSQETWSDIPVILLTAQGVTRGWESFSASGNISLLERPFGRFTLIRAVEVALRARKKQYEVRQLLEQQRQAAQKRDDFFATLSHELRTPLNVILGWTEILRAGELTKEAREEALLVLERNAHVQKALIDDLLDTSRIISGKLHFEPAPVSLSKLVLSAKRSFSPRAAEKKISISFQMPENECLVFADEPRLSQVVSNLLMNAIKFTPESGTIVLSLEQSASQYIVKVKDSGQGIDPDFLPFVFDRLKQEDMSTTRSHGGLGLGLAIAAHIVELHEGKLEVTSAGRGQGAEFTLTLPALAESARVAKVPEPLVAAGKSLKGVRVLVVDDSADIRSLIELWLKKAKADVKVTASAREALRELPSYHPDVVLSDIGMPEVDGYQFIAQVRAHGDSRVKNVRAVALTAYAKDEERTKALDAGFQLHISKPISNRELVSAVSMLVGDIDDSSGIELPIPKVLP